MNQHPTAYDMISWKLPCRHSVYQVSSSNCKSSKPSGSHCSPCQFHYSSISQSCRVFSAYRVHYTSNFLEHSSNPGHLQFHAQHSLFDCHLENNLHAQHSVLCSCPGGYELYIFRTCLWRIGEKIFDLNTPSRE